MFPTELVNEDFATYRSIEGGTLATLRDKNFWACFTYRLAHWARDARPGFWRRLACLGSGFLWLLASAIAGTEIKAGARIGRRFLIHTSQGILIADEAQIGDDCMINTGVCIVHKANSRGQGAPIIGNSVTFGVGAKVIGRVEIGDHAVVGANAVVTKSVPAWHMAIGVPAINRSLVRAEAGLSDLRLRECVTDPSEEP